MGVWHFKVFRQLLAMLFLCVASFMQIKQAQLNIVHTIPFTVHGIVHFDYHLFYLYHLLNYVLSLIYQCILYYLPNICNPGTQLNIHEDEQMKPENWIPLGWLPIINADKSWSPTQGYDISGPACAYLSV
jgi:hypothetical protein